MVTLSAPRMKANQGNSTLTSWRSAPLPPTPSFPDSAPLPYSSSTETSVLLEAALMAISSSGNAPSDDNSARVPDLDHWKGVEVSWDSRIDSINVALKESRDRLLAYSENSNQIHQLLKLYSNAQTFVWNTLLSFWKTSTEDVPVPRIDFGPDGSLDISWKTEKRRLLVNISEMDNSVSFAGIHRRRQGEDIQGYADVNQPNPWLLEWLVE